MMTKEFLKKIRRIQIQTTRLATDVIAGPYHSIFKGKGIEFEEVRSFEVGDEVRHIDWNVTARMGFPHVKTFREERELAVMLLLDVSGSQHFGSQGFLKSDLMTEVGGVLSFSAINNNDRIGLILFSDKVEKYIPPKKGARHVLRLIREMLAFKPTSQGTTISQALEFFGKVQKQRGICFLLSDFISDPFDDEMRLLAKKHDMIAIHVSDPAEQTLPQTTSMRVRDLETGEMKMICPSEVEQQLKNESFKRERYLQQIANKTGMGLIKLSTDQPYIPLLRKFFEAREKKVAMKVLLFLLLTSAIYADNYSANVELSTNSVSLTEDFLVTMHLTHPENAIPDQETITENLLRAQPSFYLVDKTMDQTSPTSTTLTWTLSPQILGKTSFSFYNIPFLREGLPPAQLISDIYSITFTKPKNGKPLVPLPLFSELGPLKLNAENQRKLLLDEQTRKWQDQVIAAKTFSFLELTVFFTFICIVIALFFLFRSGQIRKKFDVKDPKKQALQAIDNLKKKDYALYYRELAEIVRRFLKERYEIHASAKTTKEVAKELKEETINTLLKQADQVKFAKKSPSEKECREAAKNAREFVEK